MASLTYEFDRMRQQIFSEIIDIIAEHHAVGEGTVHFAQILKRYMERNGDRRLDSTQLGFGNFRFLMLSIAQVEAVDTQNYRLTLDCWNKHPRNPSSRFSNKSTNGQADKHPIRHEGYSGATDFDDDSQYQDALEFLPKNCSP